MLMRTIITSKNYDRIKTESGEEPNIDDYFTKILKLIPADIVAAWLLISGMVQLTKTDPTVPYFILIWVCFVALLGVVPIYLWKVTNVKERLQIIVQMGAFSVWAFALGVPFSEGIPSLYPATAYHAIYGQLLLIFYTLVAPMVIPE